MKDELKRWIVPLGLLSGVGLALLVLMAIPKAEAQFAGQSAFQVPFTIQPHGLVAYIPPCTPPLTPTATSPCIPNRNQLGHTISWSFNHDGGFSSYFLFQGSNDNATWQTLAAGNSGGTNALVSGMSYANAYFLYLRLLLSNTAGTLAGTYTGYSQPVPINPLSQGIRSLTVGAPATLANFGTPYIVNGFQCFNPNSTVSSGTIAFTGGGLNDLSKSGTYSCAGGKAYQVKIDGTGIPDTFKWSNDGGTTYQATGVGITGAAQLLECGISVTFGAVIGHTLNNSWAFTATDGTAYLQIRPNTAEPPFYEVGIPPKESFSYAGAPIITPKSNIVPNFRAAASTSPGSATPVASGLVCTFQVNPYGPFYPFTWQ
jgi:hypothetical protein